MTDMYKHACCSIIYQSNQLQHNELIKGLSVGHCLNSMAHKLAWSTFNSTGISAGVRTILAGWDPL